MINRMKAALNCLQGYPTLYKFHFLRGNMKIKGDLHGKIMDCLFDCSAFLIVKSSEELELEDYIDLERRQFIKNNRKGGEE